MKRTVVALNLAKLGLLSFLVLTTTVARASEVRVMISGGLTAAYKELVPQLSVRQAIRSSLLTGLRWAQRRVPYR